MTRSQVRILPGARSDVTRLGIAKQLDLFLPGHLSILWKTWRHSFASSGVLVKSALATASGSPVGIRHSHRRLSFEEDLEVDSPEFLSARHSLATAGALGSHGGCRADLEGGTGGGSNGKSTLAGDAASGSTEAGAHREDHLPHPAFAEVLEERADSWQLRLADRITAFAGRDDVRLDTRRPVRSLDRYRRLGAHA